MNYETLRWEMDPAIATITLARPEKRNAISGRMIEELLAAFEQAEKGAARVVILTGSGKAFCAGMDLEELQGLAQQSRKENLEDSRRMAALFRHIHEFPHPVIAAVNGPAIAGGCGIATLADFTLAAPEAKFGYTEVKIGFIPALVSVYLRRQIGDKRARDLLLTGRIISCGGSTAAGTGDGNRSGGAIDGACARIGGFPAERQPHQHRTHQAPAAAIRRKRNGRGNPASHPRQHRNSLNRGFSRGPGVIPRKESSALDRQIGAGAGTARFEIQSVTLIPQ